MFIFIINSKLNIEMETNGSKQSLCNNVLSKFFLI